jgi:hypothetical protein
VLGGLQGETQPRHPTAYDEKIGINHNAKIM